MAGREGVGAGRGVGSGRENQLALNQIIPVRSGSPPQPGPLCSTALQRYTGAVQGGGREGPHPQSFSGEGPRPTVAV